MSAPSEVSAGALRVTSVLPGGELAVSTSNLDGGTVSFPKVDVQTGAKLTVDGSNSLVLRGGNGVGIDFNSSGHAGQIVLDAALSGGAVNVLGGTVTFNQRNNYTGDTTVNGGRLVVGPDGTLGQDATGVPNGKLALKGGSVELNPFSVAVTAVEIGEGVISGAAGSTLAVQSTVTADVAAGKKAEISTIISDGTAGAVALFKTGAGRLVLSGDNVYTGTSTISGGVLEVASDAALGDPAALVNVSGGTLTADRTSRVVVNPVDLSGAAQLGEAGSGKLTLDGGVKVGGAPLTVVGEAEVSTVGLDARVSGGSLVFNGPGTLVLSAANTHAGTTVNGGTLVVNTNSDLGDSTGALNVNGGAVNLEAAKVEVAKVTVTGGRIDRISANNQLSVNGDLMAAIAAGGTATISAVIVDGTTSQAALTKTGAGRLVLSGENTYTGTSTINEGVVEVASAAALGDSASSVNVAGGTLTADKINRTVRNQVDLSGAAQLGETGSGRLTLEGGVKVGGAPLTVVGEVEVSNLGLQARVSGGSLVFNGPGNLVLSAGNTHTGTTVNGGTLVVNKGSNLGDPQGSLDVNGGVVRLEGTLGPVAKVEVAKATITGGRIDGTSTSDKLGVNGDLIAAIAAGGTATISAVVADGTTAQAALTKTGAGRLVLKGANEYTGTSMIHEGVVEVASAAPFGGPTALVILAGGTLTADASARVINNTVQVQSGRSTVGGDATAITVNALTFQPGAAVNVNGSMTVRETVDLSGGAVAFGTGKTNGVTLLKLENGIKASAESTISFTKDSLIQAVGGAGQKIDLNKVRLGVSPEALAETAQNLRVGSPAKFQVMALQGGTSADIEGVGSNPVFGATAAVGVSFALVEPAIVGPLAFPGISLEFTRNTYQSIAQTANAKSFAAALDQSLSQIGSASPLGQLTRSLDAIVDASGVESELRAANAGPMYASMYTVATRRSLAVTSALDSHLDSIAAGASSEAANSFGVAQVRPSVTASSASSAPAPAVADGDRQWTAWVSGYSTESNLKEDASAGFGKIRSTDTGGSLGVERKLGDLRVGFLAATGQADASFDGGGSVDTDHWHAGGYASVAIGAATVDASALWGTADNTGTRPFGGQQVRSTFGSNDTQLGLGLAFNLAEPTSLWQLTPVARLKYLAYTQDAFTETGAGFLQADKMSESTWISKLGVRFSRRAEAGKKVAIGFDGGAYWMHDYSAEGRQTNLRFTGTNTSFSARGRNADPDFVQVSAGLNAILSNTVTVRAGWQQDFGGNRSQGTGILSCAINF